VHAVQRPGVAVRAHHQPVTLEAALDLLAGLGERGRAVAGGTDLLLELARGGRADVEELVDLSRIPGLDTIGEDGGDLVLGPLVTHNQVLADERVVRGALPLAQACLELGAPPLRNRATVAGNLVTASPANDTISALLALGATVDVASAGGATRRLAVDELITGFRTTALAAGELVTAVRVPALAGGRRGVFVKLGLRRAQAISVVHLAAVLGFGDDGVVVDARLAIGSVAPTVVRCPAAEAAVVGTRLDDGALDAAAAAAVASVRPIDDVRATAAYRSEQTGVMVRRALVALRDGRERETWPARPALLHVRRPAAPGLSAPVTHAGPGDEVAAEVNGEAVTAGRAVGRTLLDWLRDEAGLTGTKEGCAEGECGACTVLLDGRAVLACLVPAARAHGAAVRTIEGLDPDGRHPLQDAYVRAGAVQCGFCIPGFLVAGAALLDTCPSPDRDEVERGLAGNLCRCTGYYSMLEAVQAAAGAG
jgi:xanthine dehydrogenase iron-sulfur cluster and FAD-binding subunit A